jgi:site-specific DNA-adenine methylase
MATSGVSLSLQKEGIPPYIRERLMTAAQARIGVKRERIFPRAKPFLIYPGGKSALQPQIDDLLPCPSRYGGYAEICLGGGATFFHLQGIGALEGKKVVLNDANPEIVNAWCQLQKYPDAVRRARDNAQLELTKKEYKRMKAEYNRAVAARRRNRWQESRMDDATRAFYLIYLSQTSRGGYRISKKKGMFNLPFADRSKDRQILPDSEIDLVVSALAGVTIRLGDFEFIADPQFAPEGTLVVADVPYYTEASIDAGGRRKAAGFTAYTTQAFTPLDLARLRRVTQILYERGCNFMLHNSFHPRVVEQMGHPAFNRGAIFRYDAANRNVSARGFIPEYVFRCFRTPNDDPFLAEAQRLEQLAQAA